MIEGVEPDAIKVASPVLNGGDEETGLVRPRLVATQLHLDMPRAIVPAYIRCVHKQMSHGETPTRDRYPPVKRGRTHSGAWIGRGEGIRKEG